MAFTIILKRIIKIEIIKWYGKNLIEYIALKYKRSIRHLFNGKKKLFCWRKFFYKKNLSCVRKILIEKNFILCRNFFFFIPIFIKKEKWGWFFYWILVI
jgi:hypothetical protein